MNELYGDQTNNLYQHNQQDLDFSLVHHATAIHTKELRYHTSCFCHAKVYLVSYVFHHITRHAIKYKFHAIQVTEATPLGLTPRGVVWKVRGMIRLVIW